MNDFGEKNPITETDMVLPQVVKHGRKIERFQQKGSPSLEDYFGLEWENRTINKSFVDALDKSYQAKVIGRQDVDEVNLTENHQKLVLGLEKIGSSLDVITLKKNGETHRYLFSYREVHNCRGGKVCNVHEVIDLDDDDNYLEKFSRDGSKVWVFSGEKIFISFDNPDGFTKKVLSVNDLTQRKLSFTFAEFDVDDKSRRDRLAKGFVARMKSADRFSIMNLSPIRDMKDMYSFLHEFGHFANLVHYDWLDEQTLAREIFKNKLEKKDGMTNFQARTLVSMDERKAWQFCEKFINWMNIRSQGSIPVEERFIYLKNEIERALLTYDYVEDAGPSEHPVAFSELMKKAREEYKSQPHETKYLYSPDTGERIANCPFNQMARVIMSEKDLDIDGLIDFIVEAKGLCREEIEPLVRTYIK